MFQNQTLKKFIIDTNVDFANKKFIYFCLMNLLSILQKERSKKTCIEVADYIGNSPERFAELIDIIIGKDMEMANRAARVIPSIADKNINKLIQPHFSRCWLPRQYQQMIIAGEDACNG
jgi:hypothetical protein